MPAAFLLPFFTRFWVHYGRKAMARMNVFLELMQQMGAADLHLLSGSPPLFRVDGTLVPMAFRELSRNECRGFLFEILSEQQKKVFDSHGDLDFAYNLPGVARFRVNYFQHYHGTGAVFRLIPHEVPSWEQLGLPAMVERIPRFNQGLVLCTGPTGSGKSTTLAAILSLINQKQSKFIATVEDPIEFVHRPVTSVFCQREIGVDTPSYSAGIVDAIMEGADVLFVGELRDRDALLGALRAVDAGMLVLSTLHTGSSWKTVDRLVNLCLPDEQPEVRTMLALALRGILCQRLIRRADGKGRLPAVEILVNTPAVANLIRENKSYLLPTAMQNAQKEGMRTLAQDLQRLIEEKAITPQDAHGLVENPPEPELAPRTPAPVPKVSDSVRIRIIREEK